MRGVMGKRRSIGMIIRFPRRGESDSLPACRRLQISHADLKGLVLKLLEE